LPLVLIAALAGCGGSPRAQAQPVPPPPNGPAADYPVVLGAPFQVDETTYTPEDRLNYDAVGHADVGADGGPGVSAAHKTLPLPSYVEVTGLDSGRTILVRVERRGPMRNDRLIELSPGAAAQLGLDGDKPAVRVRRVNPPEQERAMLRAGGRAPERMETPRGLLDALNRKLAGSTASLPPGLPTVASPAVKPVPAPAPMSPPVAAAKAVPTPAATPKPAAVPAPAAAPAPRVAARALVVQVGAYSTEARTKASADRVGGSASRAGSLWRVRMGPFADRAEAEAALAKARTAGYSDARIQRAD